MIRLFWIALLGAFLALPATCQEWKWESGGSFWSVAVQQGSGTDETIWLAGNLLVRGSRSNGEWQWTQVAPELTEQSSMGRLTFFGTAAMAITATGVVYTPDAFQSWTIHPLPTNIEYLQNFQMTGPGQAYAVGRNTDEQAILVSTNDSGATWQPVYDSDDWPGNFVDLKIYGDGSATLVGNYLSQWMGWRGVIIETTDSFATVSRVDYDDQSLWALEAPTRADHYALGGPDLPGTQRPILVYRHGEGAGWTNSSLPGDVFQISDMLFDSAQHGWVVGHFSDLLNTGRGGVLLETQDGGASWSRTNFCVGCVGLQSNVVEPLELPNYLAQSGDDLFVGQSAGGWPCASDMCTGRVLQRRGDGTWQRVDKLTGYRFEDVHLPRGRSGGFALGYDGRTWEAFSQALTGETWDAQTYTQVPCSFFGTCPPTWGRAEVLDDGRVMASAVIGNDPAQLMLTADRGRTWTFLDTGHTLSQRAPVFSVSGSDIWASIVDSEYNHKLIASSDFGANWRTIVDNGTNLITTFARVSDSQYCWVGRSMGCTKNGGVHWSYPSGPSVYTELLFIDEDYGLAAGLGSQGGLLIIRTTDGGATWHELTHLDRRVQEQWSGAAGHRQMHFINRMEGWLAVGVGSGQSAGLLRTVDGGVTWTQVDDGVDLGGDLMGYVYDVTAEGAGWLVSRHTGLVLKRVSPRVFYDGFEG